MATFVSLIFLFAVECALVKHKETEVDVRNEVLTTIKCLHWRNTGYLEIH